MRLTVTYLSIGIGCVVIVAITAYFLNFLNFPSHGLPTDAELTQTFNGRASDFEAVRDSFNKNPQITTLWNSGFPEGFGTEPGSDKAAFSKEQIVSFAHLVDRTGADYVSKRHGENPTLEFAIANVDIEPYDPYGSWYAVKGIAYSEHELSPLSSKLDTTDDCSQGLTYKPLAPHWYIYCFEALNKPE